MILKLHPLPDDAQRRILILTEAECESSGSGFFVFNKVLSMQFPDLACPQTGSSGRSNLKYRKCLNMIHCTD